jgi:hypothetical protein
MMRMLPEQGVGVFVMANRTYAPAGGMARQALEILRGTGALVPRELPASATLVSMREKIASLLDRWDDGAARALAADNFFLDRPLPERRDEIARLRERHGRCRPGDLRPENWLRGRFRSDCERGWVDVDFTLAPTQPPRLQFLHLSSGLPPSDRMAATAGMLGALATAWTDAAAAEVAGPSLDRARLQAQLGAIGDRYGACRLGPALDGDGARAARIRFECDRGALEVSLQMDEAGRLAAASFAPPRETTCVP